MSDKNRKAPGHVRITGAWVEGKCCAVSVPTTGLVAALDNASVENERIKLKLATRLANLFKAIFPSLLGSRSRATAQQVSDNKHQQQGYDKLQANRHGKVSPLRNIGDTRRSYRMSLRQTIFVVMKKLAKTTKMLTRSADNIYCNPAFTIASKANTPKIISTADIK